ncbi:hypothetical protein [Arthrobacter sp. SO5]|uniref:hypothetical protein n=1 Tax=Arthrobacter sp. SO5 TaxID=1897055 RepID=UPI001E62A688|nr:hypothetical protein [Arthrobacter sp. SO5]
MRGTAAAGTTAAGAAVDFAFAIAAALAFAFAVGAALTFALGEDAPVDGCAGAEGTECSPGAERAASGGVTASAGTLAWMAT